MQYFGGKARINKQIAEFLEGVRKPNQTYVETMVGGGWVVSQMSGNRRAYDKHKYLIAMYNALQEGWTPPTDLTKDEYYNAKENQDSMPHLAGFVGFGCSFAGKWWGGFARAKGRNYCQNAHNSIMKKMKSMQDVEFNVADYKDLDFEGCLIYCDPPYKNTTQYDKSVVGSFDHDEFWNWVRGQSKKNTVIVSEYQAPSDFKCVWEYKTKTDIRNKDGEKELRVERLFQIIK